MDEDRDIKSAVSRAEVLLEAMSKTKGTAIHVYEHPAGVIRDLMTDLMHYAAARNIGKRPDDVFYVDMNKEFELAKKQYIAEQERIPLKIDPKLEQIMSALNERQQQERIQLVLRQTAEAKKQGNTQDLQDTHKKQVEQQDKKFTDERQRYVREYNNAQRIEAELRTQQKTDALSMDGPKRSK